MEWLFLLKEIFLPGDKMLKMDLEDAYFAIPLSAKSRKYVRYLWKDLQTSFSSFASDFLQLLWSLQSY